MTQIKWPPTNPGRFKTQFKQAQKPQPTARPTTEGGRAKADYVAAGLAERAKTVRLKALREAKESADKKKGTT